MLFLFSLVVMLIGLGKVMFMMVCGLVVGFLVMKFVRL